MDGAHAVPVPDLDVVDIDADFFFTNFHKWGLHPTLCRRCTRGPKPDAHDRAPNHKLGLVKGCPERQRSRARVTFQRSWRCLLLWNICGTGVRQCLVGKRA